MIVGLIAFVLRAALVLYAATVDLPQPPDAMSYDRLARVLADDRPVPATDASLVRGQAAYLYLLAAAYEVWASTTAGRLLGAVLGALTVAMVGALGVLLGGRRLGLVSGLLAAVLPGSVLFSAGFTLKDPLVWLASATIAVSLAAVCNPYRRWPGAVWSIGVVAGLAGLVFLREHSGVVAALAIALAVVMAVWRRPRGKVVVGVAVVACAAVATLLVGVLGPNAVDLLDTPGALAGQRARSAWGADSAMVSPAFDPDQVSPAEAAQALGADRWDDIGHLPRGLAAVTVEPLPWSAGDDELRLAGWGAVVVVPVLVLAVLGLWRWLRRDRDARLVYPMAYLVSLLLFYALLEGNLGTAFRHRAELEWVMALFAGYAAAGPSGDQVQMQGQGAVAACTSAQEDALPKRSSPARDRTGETSGYVTEDNPQANST